MKKLDRKSRKRKPAIFLSHSSKDNILVTQLALHLNHLGIDVWMDDWELEVGDNLNQRNREAIQKSQYLGIVVTPSFLKSEWCKKELADALAKEKALRKKVVLPLRFKKAKMPELLVEERIYLDFTLHYFTELAQLAGMIHGFSRKKLTTAIGYKHLKKINEVEDLLKTCGWDGVSLIDADYFNDVKKLKGVTVRGNTIEFYPDEVVRLNPKISKVLKQLILQ